MLNIYKDSAVAELTCFMDVVNQLLQSYLSSTRDVSITQTDLATSTSNSICINTDIGKFIYEDNDVAKGEINELDVYMKDKPIRWVDPTGKVYNLTYYHGGWPTKLYIMFSRVLLMMYWLFKSLLWPQNVLSVRVGVL
jgi:hypothetical protein